MRTYKYLIFINFIILNCIGFINSAERERRQLFYGDIRSRPSTPFFSRREEQTDTRNTAEESKNIKTDIPPAGSIYQLFSEKTKILANPPPDGPPFKAQFNSYDEPFYPKSSKYIQKPTYGGSIHPKPKPAYEEPYHPKPTYEKPIRYKPKPAYEESYMPQSYFEHGNLFPQASVSIHEGKKEYHSRPSFGSSHDLTSSAFPKSLHQANEYSDHKKEKKSNIPGEPGKDYPVYNEVPGTSFSCEGVPFRPGMYANPEAGCQAYHVCHDNRHGHQGASFLCTNGTIFNQETFNCDWWYNVDCSKATSLYKLNSDPEFNPYYQKPKEDLSYKSTDNIGHKVEGANQQLKSIKSSNSFFEPQFPAPFQNIEESEPFAHYRNPVEEVGYRKPAEVGYKKPAVEEYQKPAEVGYRKPAEEYRKPVENTGYRREASVHHLKPLLSKNSVHDALPSFQRKPNEPLYSATFNSDFPSFLNQKISPQQPNIKSNPFASINPFKKEIEDITDIIPQYQSPNRRVYEIEQAKKTNSFVHKFEEKSDSLKPEDHEEENKSAFQRPQTPSATSLRRVLKRKRTRPNKAEIPTVTTPDSQQAGPPYTIYPRRKNTEKTQFREEIDETTDEPSGYSRQKNTENTQFTDADQSPAELSVFPRKKYTEKTQFGDIDRAPAELLVYPRQKTQEKTRFKNQAPTEHSVHPRRKITEKSQFRENLDPAEISDDVTLDFEWGQRTS